MTEAHEAARTDWGAMRAVLAPGDLLVAREGLAVLVVDARTPAQEATADRLLELCALAGRAPADGATEGLVRSVAALLTNSDVDDVPALGMVNAGQDGLLVTLTAGMRMAVTHPDGGTEVVDAEDSLLPVNRILRDPEARILIAPDPTAVVPDRRSNLSGGVVRAGGLLLVAGDDGTAHEQMSPETLVDLVPPPVDDLPVPPAPGASPSGTQPASVRDAAPAEPEPSFEVFSLDAGGDDEQDRSSWNREQIAEGVASEAAETARGDTPSDDKVTLVRGIVCSRGHLNPPDARFCERCGISTVHQTHNLVTGARPPLGVLVLDDGSLHNLVRDVVVGRDPDTSDAVQSGRASALLLEDPELSLSRVHAELVLDGWEVRVVDAGSANGTFLAEVGSDDWRRLEAGLPTTIVPGARLRMGSRTLTFESHHRV